MRNNRIVKRVAVLAAVVPNSPGTSNLKVGVKVVRLVHVHLVIELLLSEQRN